MAKKKKTKKQIQKNNELMIYIISLISIALIIISILQLGYAGELLDKTLKSVFGFVPYYFIMLQLIGYCSYMIIQAKTLPLTSRYVIGSSFFIFGLLLLFACFDIKQVGFASIHYNDLVNQHVGLIQIGLYGPIF